MQKNILFPLVFIFLMSACSKEKKQTTFGKNHVGPVHSAIKPEQVNQLFTRDSIGKLEESQGIVQQKTQKIYDPKTGQPLLELIFQNQGDSLQLHAIEIISKKYVSDKGVPAFAPLREWKSKHKLTKADRTLRHIIVYVDDINATLTFKEEDLPYNLQHRPLSKVDPDLIKKDARPSNVIVFFNEK